MADITAIRRLLALCVAAAQPPPADPDATDHPAQAREELRQQLQDAGLGNHEGLWPDLLGTDSAARLQACRLVAAHLPGDGGASPLAVDWLLAR